jgi:hypothetical protein
MASRRSGVRAPYPPLLKPCVAKSYARLFVKLRPTRQREDSFRRWFTPAGGNGRSYRPSGDRDRHHHEVSAMEGVVVLMANAARRSAERFQGKNGWMSAGSLPPAAAQLSKYHVSHNRGLIFQWESVSVATEP